MASTRSVQPCLLDLLREAIKVRLMDVYADYVSPAQPSQFDRRPSWSTPDVQNARGFQSGQHLECPGGVLVPSWPSLGRSVCISKKMSLGIAFAIQNGGVSFTQMLQLDATSNHQGRYGRVMRRGKYRWPLLCHRR